MSLDPDSCCKITQMSIGYCVYTSIDFLRILTNFSNPSWVEIQRKKCSLTHPRLWILFSFEMVCSSCFLLSSSNTSFVDNNSSFKTSFSLVRSFTRVSNAFALSPDCPCYKETKINDETTKQGSTLSQRFLGNQHALR